MKPFTIATLLCLSLFSCQNKTAVTEADTSVVDSTQIPEVVVKENIDGATEEEILASEESANAEQDTRDFDLTYEGLLNNQIKVKVNIFKYRGEQKARAVYLSTKKIINMDAEYPSIGSFELTEKIKEKPTGIWKISTAEEDIFTGTWSAPDGSKQLPITLSMTEADFDDFLPKEEIKTGFYVLQEMNEDAETKAEFPLLYSEELYVKNMADHSIYFDLYIQGSPPGVHVGMVNGFAYQSGNAYVYKNENGCEITMTFSNNKVSLSQKGNDMNCEFGQGIGAFGTLEKKK